MSEAFKIINGRIIPPTEITREMNNFYNYRSSFEIINFSRYNLYICNRDGIITEIKANTALLQGDVLRDYIYIIHSRATDANTTSGMIFVNGHEDPELQAIRANQTAE